MAVNNVFQMLAQQEIDRPERDLKRLQLKTLMDEAKYKEQSRLALSAPQQPPTSLQTLGSMGAQAGPFNPVAGPQMASMDPNAQGGTLAALGVNPMQQQVTKPLSLLDGFQREYNYHNSQGRRDEAKKVLTDQMEFTMKVADYADKIHKVQGPEGVAAWMKANPEISSVLGDPSNMKIMKDGIAYPVTKNDSNETLPGVHWLYLNGTAQLVKEDKPQALQTVPPGYGVADGKGGFTVPVPAAAKPDQEALIDKRFANQQKLTQMQIDAADRRAAKGGGAGGQGKPPAGYRWSADGNLEAIPGGPAEAKAEAAKQGKEKAKGAYDASITVVDKLLAHPGRKTATGLSAKLDPRNYTAGTDAYDFQKELESFDAVLFLSNIEKMKGMGALSNAEGAKVSSAAGAIKPGMSEKAFEANLRIIKNELSKAKTRIDGGTAQPSPANPGPKLSRKAQTIADRY